MGHKVYLSHLVAVQIDGGGAQLLSLLDGSGDALGQVEGIAHLIVAVAVAADRRGGVQLHSRLGAALGQVYGGQHGLGIHQRPVGKAGKGPVKQVVTRGKQVIQRVAAKDHQPIVVAVLLGKGHDAAACQRGKAALDPLDILPVVGAFAVHQAVGAADGVLGLAQIGGRQHIAGGARHLCKGLVLRAGGGDLCQILRGGHVAVIKQAVGTGKVRAGAAQLCRFGVHLLHKTHHAAPHVPRNDAGGVVGADDEHSVQQVDAAHGLADAQPHGGAVGVLDILELLRQVGGHGHFTVQILAAFHQQQGGHQLGQACHIFLLVGVLAQDGLAGVRVEQIHCLSLCCSLDGHGVYCKYRQHCRKSHCQCEHQRRQTAAERVVKHEGTPLNPAPAKPARTFLFLTYKNTIKEPKEKGGF